MNKRDLWLRIHGYHFDHLVPTLLWQHIAANFGGPHASSKAFAAKIARKHGWRKGFALKALGEYKKFIYLGITSDFQVTPSKVIDIVWHEHLLFTKGYRQFCADVIEYEFDHYPELVPMIEQTGQFSAQYLETLEWYKAEFKTDPPADIWETTKYDQEKLADKNYQSSKKKLTPHSSHYNSYYSDAPLYTFFDNAADGHNGNAGEFAEGDFGGAGASGSWGASENSDTGTADAGSDGGSSCSSGCGGGD